MAHLFIKQHGYQITRSMAPFTRSMAPAVERTALQAPPEHHC
jgi:hypothetical protein